MTDDFLQNPSPLGTVQLSDEILGLGASIHGCSKQSICFKPGTSWPDRKSIALDDLVLFLPTGGGFEQQRLPADEAKGNQGVLSGKCEAIQAMPDGECN